MAADILNIDTGNPTIYNGSIIVNPGVGGNYFKYLRDDAISTPEIDDITGLYDDRFNFYEPTGGS